MLWRVYIDERAIAESPRLRREHFLVSAIVVRDDSDRTVRRELGTLRQALGRKPGQVLHFQKFSHSQRLRAVQDLARVQIDAISNVILCKPKLYRHGRSNVTSYGLKVFPGKACRAGASLGWLRDL